MRIALKKLFCKLNIEKITPITVTQTPAQFSNKNYNNLETKKL